MKTERPKVIYTLTDEAPLLATCSLLPVIRTFASGAGIEITKNDLSLPARIRAEFADYLSAEQQTPDDLGLLAKLTQVEDTNIIKLPNISASVPQLTATIRELQAAGYAVPDYPEDPQTDTEREILQRYAKVLGSAVNPVLREGNSDRRVPAAVKRYAQTYPHEMKEWSQASRTHVSGMEPGLPHPCVTHAGR